MYSIGIIKYVPEPACGFEFGIKYNGQYITNRDVLTLMKTRPDLWHALLQRAIIETENCGNFFEMPKLTTKLLNTPFKAALVGTNEFIDVQPNPNAFNFNGCNKVLVTKSPSGTVLVIPTPDQNADYSHITNFMKNCDVPETIDEYWVAVATEIEKHMSQNRNTWVSTHGLGIPWLHMRISSVPRYYASDYGNN